MGGAVSVDGHEVLEAALEQSQNQEQALPRSTCHLLAWRFRRLGHSVQEEIFPLIRYPPVLDHRSAFVILYVHADDSPSPLDAVVTSAIPMFTPRGLTTEVSSCCVDDWLRKTHLSTRFSIFAWNGKEVDISAKSVALSKALGLNLRIRKQPSALERLLSFPGQGKRMTKLQLTEPVGSRGDELPDMKAFRKVMSEIVSQKIYISSAVIAQDLKTLQSHGITHVLNLAGDACPCPFEGEVEYLCLKVLDAKDENLSCIFPACFDFIEKGTKSKSRILVHCMEGVSRSASIVIAYLMWKKQLSFEAASELVRKGRPICSPNAGFICQLLAFGKRLSGIEQNELLQFRPHTSDSSLNVLATVKSDELDPAGVYVTASGSKFDVWKSENSHASDDEVVSSIQRHCKVHRISDALISFVSAPPGNLLMKSETLTKSQIAPQAPLQQLHISDSELFKFPNLSESLERFDSDDLDCRFVFVLISKKTQAWVWVGSQSSQADECFEAVSALSPVVVHEGRESSDFWDLFPDG